MSKKFPIAYKKDLFKRIFDIAFSITALFLLFPLFLLIVIAIKATSQGPILYAQKRIGCGGIPFYCYKFRTMFQNSEKKLQKLLKKHPKMQKEWSEKRKLSCDPRITPVGIFLRKTSLDELPQFFNVLFGNMSVVGPRPVVEEEVELFYKKKASKLLSVRPGITGLWQVSGRSELCYKKRIALDLEYIKNRSFVKDLQIILRTFKVVFSRKGAY